MRDIAIGQVWQESPFHLKRDSILISADKRAIHVTHATVVSHVSHNDAHRERQPSQLEVLMMLTGAIAGYELTRRAENAATSADDLK